MQLTEGQKADIRAKVAAEVNSNPNGIAAARSWLSGKSAEEQQNAYQKKYAPPAEPKKGKKEKQAELEQNQNIYDQEDRDRTAVYEWNQSAKKIMEQGAREGKSPAEIQAMLPPQPILSRRAPQESHGPDMIQKMLDFTGIGKQLEKMRPALDAWQLEHVIPQKPDYLSKHTEKKKVYLSRYTFQVLVIDPQVLIAEINILFGAVAIIGAFWTGGGSLYLLAIADGVIGASMVAVNIEKLIDLKNGNGNTNPNILGIDQKMLDDMGLALAFVNLAFLMKHGLYKAADKLANSRNIVALEELEDALKAGGTGNYEFINDLETMKNHIIVPDNGFQAFLERKYIQIRMTGLDDISTVSKNTGLTEEEVLNMKKHLFLDTHNLSIAGKPYEKLYFQADPDIAHAWQKAQKGELTDLEKEWFRKLANHELTEKELMDNGTPLRDRSTWDSKEEQFKIDPAKNAHDKANETAPNPPPFPGYDSGSDFITINEQIRFQ